MYQMEELTFCSEFVNRLLEQSLQLDFKQTEHPKYPEPMAKKILIIFWKTYKPF